MNIAQKVLARRYAIAYVNTFDQQLDKDNIAFIKQAIPFFKRHAKALYFLTLPNITVEHKVAAMTKIIHKLHLPTSLNQLLEVLIGHKRTSLWCVILDVTVSYYYEKHNIVDVVVESFPELCDSDKQLVEQSCASLIKQDMLYSYQLCPELIAGLRMTTDNLMWEYSIAKKLRMVRATVLEPYER